MRECQDTSPIGIKRKKRLTFLSIRNFLCTDNNLVPVRWIEKSTRLALVYRRKKRRQGKEKQRYRSTLVRTCARETNREVRIAAHSSLSLDWFALICSRWQEWSDEAHIEKKLFTHFSSQQLVHIVFKHAREKMSISLSLAQEWQGPQRDAIFFHLVIPCLWILPISSLFFTILFEFEEGSLI